MVNSNICNSWKTVTPVLPICLSSSLIVWSLNCFNLPKVHFNSGSELSMVDGDHKRAKGYDKAFWQKISVARDDSRIFVLLVTESGFSHD